MVLLMMLMPIVCFCIAKVRNYRLEVLSLDLKAILNGTAPDVKLKRNDLLVISSIKEIQDRGQLSIQGHVARPGTYPFADNTTL